MWWASMADLIKKKLQDIHTAGMRWLCFPDNAQTLEF